jgi:type IV pilus assembly protein PilM
MGLFLSNPPSYLGIDLGLGGVKIVELRNNKGRAQLLTYGFAEEEIEIGQEEYFSNIERLTAIIKKICDQANTTSKQVIASLPTYTVFDSVITLPFMAKKDLKPAIEAEAKKLLSRPLEEMVLYWNILNEDEPSSEKVSKGKEEEGEERDVIVSKKTKYLKILLTAAPKDFVNRYVEIFHKAGLKLLSLETAAFSLTRSLAGADKSRILITDIGAGTTEIIILDQGLPVFSRSIDIGGFKITRALQESLKISFEEAEQLKLDISNNPSNQSAEIIKTLEKIMAPIINEIKYSITLYFNRLSLVEKEEEAELQTQKRIEKIIVTGGSGLLGGLNDYIKKELQLRVFVGDPWSRVIYPQDLKPLLNEIGPKFAVAIGLAMREIL